MGIVEKEQGKGKEKENYKDQNIEKSEAHGIIERERDI